MAASLGYAIFCTPAIAAGKPAEKCIDSNYRDGVVERRLRHALLRLSPNLPPGVVEDAFRRLTLAALRDTLLPRVLSGEIRVKEISRD